MIKPEHLKRHVIEPTLKYLERINPKLNSKAAVNLLMGTVAHESHGGHYLKQVGGPALGIFQIEPATHKDIYENFLAYDIELKTAIQLLTLKTSLISEEMELINNLMYSCAIARLIFWRVSEPLPHENDINGVAGYWKKYYNTCLGAGTEEQFKTSYLNYCK